MTKAAETDRVLARHEHPEDLFRTMADSAPVLLWMARASDGLCTFFNQTWLSFTGRTLAQEEGVGWAEGVHPEDFESCMSGYTRAFRARQAFELVYRLRRHDGEYRWILDRGAPRFTAAGAFAGYIGSCVDITERIQREEQTRRALHEKETLLDEVLHRVKNNLQVVESLLDMKARRTPAGPERQALVDARNRVQSMALIHHVLYHDGDVDRVDLRGFLEIMLPRLKSSFGPEAERIALQVESAPLHVPLGTAIPLGLIANELVSNAFKHGFADGRGSAVKVALSAPHAGRASIEVSNDGVPLASADANGSGLGLGLVRMLTGQIGGTFTVQRESPVRFRVEFPGNAG